MKSFQIIQFISFKIFKETLNKFQTTDVVTDKAKSNIVLECEPGDRIWRGFKLLLYRKTDYTP